MRNESVGDILSFWFGEDCDPVHITPEQRTRWFGKNPSLDTLMGSRFSETVQRAAQGELSHFLTQPKGRLAIILLLDQFSRNIWRNTAGMYQYDTQALRHASELIENNEHHNYDPIERVFIYLPLEHTEDLILQKKAVSLFKELRDSLPQDQRPSYQGSLDYALKHQEVIEQFGRFPHRNNILNRASTPAELKYLAQPGSGF